MHKRQKSTEELAEERRCLQGLMRETAVEGRKIAGRIRDRANLLGRTAQELRRRAKELKAAQDSKQQLVPCCAESSEESSSPIAAASRDR